MRCPIDHPDRVRISINGDAVLAFPATLADADSTSDVRGLGAMLYSLITARWPLADPSAGPVGGLLPAGAGADGNIVEPSGRPSGGSVRHLGRCGSSVAVGEWNPALLATVQHILDQASVVNDKTEMIRHFVSATANRVASGHALNDPEAIEAEKKKSTRMLAALTALVSSP